ncbi:hypothetical protein M422DRAFT_254370 [Sphaerobolus stellatus SS14]|uniref:Unplaced genomic scaffold SPHSTscaffold_54, whole genome shotgun sequence n=1 Tax=Sphaerobolus stellatus (strain SS14) TaxID=990650 RepID=A0A0C9V6H8_SPHS4|nr:hypothetical protein M422DRAFT_254370 [Sphaerobolus stellatus SS14]
MHQDTHDSIKRAPIVPLITKSFHGGVTSPSPTSSSVLLPDSLEDIDVHGHRGLPYKKRTELETPRTFWVSLLHKLDATAQKVVNKINPVKPAVKFFDNFQGNQKLDLKKAEHHCRVDYGPPEGGAMKLNRWSSNPVLRTVEPHNAMHIGADDHIERIDSSPDTTPQQSVSSSDRIGANWIE